MRWQENATKRKMARKLFKKGCSKSEKKHLNDQIFTKTHPHALRSKLQQKIAINFEEKAIRKTEIRKKQTKKTSKFQLKQVQKQATRKSSKKSQFHKKSINSRENRKIDNTDHVT